MSPKIRQSLYYLGAMVPSVLGFLLIWGGIDQGAADNLGQIVAGIINMVGAAAPATAAVKVGQQRKDGTFDTPSAADRVISGVQEALAQQQAAQDELDRVKDAVAGAIGAIPVLGPLASQVLEHRGAHSR